MEHVIRLALYLFVVSSNFVFTNAREGPVAPEKYYAIKNSKAELPCAAGSPGDRLRWTARHADNSLKSRQASYTDKEEPDINILVIKNVQPSDAGKFICSDGRASSTVELIVVEISHPEEITAQITAPDEMKVKWEAPLKSPEAVRGYNIYSREVTGSSREVKFYVENQNPSGKKEFTLKDMSPGATFEIQVAALYAQEASHAGKTVEGPRSSKVSINTPNFDAPPSRVRAEPGQNSSIIVTWQPPRNVNPRGIDGYTVFFEGVARRNPPVGQVVVTRPGPGNRWQAVLEGLRTRIRYKISVAAFSGGPNGQLGRRSPEVVFRHDGFNPEISISAMPLGPESVLVTLETLGYAKVDKLRLLYSDDSAVKWQRVKGYKPKERYAVVTGLQPRSRYFFMAKAKVNNKARQTITDILTPPTGLASPTNVAVTAQTDNGVLVTWDYAGRLEPKGFIVLVARQLPNGQFSPYKQQAAFDEHQALIRDLSEDQKYQIKVVPFDLDGKGPASESVLFHIAQANVDVTTPQPKNQPPRFVDQQPERLEIDAGENVKLTCTAVGFPFPVVQWFQDGTLIGDPANRRNEIFLSQVQESTVLTCRVSNPHGAIERTTEVDVAQTEDPEPPSLVQPLPEFLIVNKGEDIRKVCAAVGNPMPKVSWYKDNFPVRSRQSFAGRSEFIERNVQRSFILKCVAENKYGKEDGKTEVLIKEFLQKPVLVGDMPRRIDKIQGEKVDIPCAFTGNPTPTVTWYDSNTPVGPPTLSQNNLMIPSVQKSTYLRCIGENAGGRTEALVQLIVRQRRPGPPDERPAASQSDYSVSLRKIPKSESAVDIKWIIDRGDLEAIRMFQATLSTAERGQVLTRQRLSPDQRSVTLTNLTPNLKHIMNLMTITSAGMVDNSSLEFVPSASDVPPAVTEPELQVEIVEVRDTTARVDFTVLPDISYVTVYRLQIQDLELGPVGNVIFNRQLPPSAPSITLERLKPLRRYQCIVDAFLASNLPTLTSKLIFTTSAPGGYGKPVSSSSSSPTPEPTELNTPPLPPLTTSTTMATSTARPEDTTTEDTTTEDTTPATAPMTEKSTEMKSAATTTIQPKTSLSESTTASTSESPREDDDYVMTVKTANKTPYRVDIRWTVDRGDLEGVKNFMVTIKGDQGQQLLQQELSGIQRSITIQSLSPNTQYFVNVKALGDDGDLVEYNLPVRTPSADSTPDTSNPVLDLEANEIRSTTARLDWIVVNGEPDIVKSYKLRVLDGGPGGFNLLTQIVPASSLSLNLQKLLPNKRYHVIVDALDAEGKEMMTSSLTFQTAPSGGYGIPVRASSADEPRERNTDRMEDRTRSRNVDPTLNIEVSPVGQSSAKVDWNLENVSSASVRQFFIRVKIGNNLLLEQRVHPRIRSFTIDGLLANTQYTIEVEVDSPTPLMAQTLYSTDRGPVKASSTPSRDFRQPSHKQPQQVDENDDASKPTINLEINPVEAGRARLNWTMDNENSRQPVRSFRVKVNENGPEGRNMLDQALPSQATAYTVSGLRPSIRYYVQLEAMDPRGQSLALVATPYLVPPPGHSVAPIRASSAPRKPQTNEKAQPDSQQKLVIVKSETRGPNAILVEWFDPNSPTGVPTRNTMLRHAQFKDNKRDRFNITFIPAGRKETILTGLTPDTVYGIQVASVSEGSRYVQWSDLVMQQTEKS